MKEKEEDVLKTESGRLYEVKKRSEDTLELLFNIKREDLVDSYHCSLKIMEIAKEIKKFEKEFRGQKYEIGIEVENESSKNLIEEELSSWDKYIPFKLGAYWALSITALTYLLGFRDPLALVIGSGGAFLSLIPPLYDLWQQSKSYELLKKKLKNIYIKEK